MDHFISPHFQNSYLQVRDIEKTIDVFEDQVKDWLIAPAKMMTGNQHAGLAILALSLSYMEPLGHLLTGESSGVKKHFRIGLKRIFPTTAPPDPVLDDLYDKLRNGMFHEGMTKAYVYIRRDITSPIEVGSRGVPGKNFVYVNPWLLLNSVESHLSRYVAELRDPAETTLRENFMKWFYARGN